MSEIKIAYGVYNQLDRIKNFDLYLKVKGSTLFYLERLSKKLISHGKQPLKIICEDDIKNILETAYNENYNYCVVQAAGCQIRNYNFDKDILEFISSNDFGVAGHPLWHSDNKWLELHHQFFIVNLNAWNNVGRPEFGNWEFGERLLPVLTRSEENFHDHYTPLWVKSTGSSALQLDPGQGWKLTSAMFLGGYEVITLTEKIRLSKFYTYPEADTDNFYQRIEKLEVDDTKNWNQNKWIGDSLLVKDQIWLFNSENLNIDNAGPYDLVINTASGFKLFDFFRTPRLNQDAQIIVYDFNPKSIMWYKFLYTYPNENLLECIRAFPFKNNFTWIGQTNAEFTENVAFNKLLEDNYNFFGGHDRFQEYWRMFKNTQVKFYEIDLFKNPNALSKHLTKKGKKWINLTNIFSTDASQLIFGHAECMSAQYKCLGSIYVTDPETDVTFFDFWGRYKFGAVKNIL